MNQFEQLINYENIRMGDEIYAYKSRRKYIITHVSPKEIIGLHSRTFEMKKFKTKNRLEIRKKPIIKNGVEEEWRYFLIDKKFFAVVFHKEPNINYSFKRYFKIYYGSHVKAICVNEGDFNLAEEKIKEIAIERWQSNELINWTMCHSSELSKRSKYFYLLYYYLLRMNHSNIAKWKMIKEKPLVATTEG